MGKATENRAAVERVVQDHAGWVFAAARRRVGDAALAEDVTQAVFLLYWRKGMAIGQQGMLTGWLYRAVRYCAANALRLQRIRQRHEREAAMQRQQDHQAAAGWSEIEVGLEGAIDRLPEKDRQAVVLRFYRGLSLREVGAALGLREDAARMRVDRAVGKLREQLAVRGVEAQTVGLSGLLLAHAGMRGPAGLVEKVMAGHAEGIGSNVAGEITHGAAKMMMMAKLKVAAAVMTVVVVAGVGAGVAETVSDGMTASTPAVPESAPQVRSPDEPAPVSPNALPSTRPLPRTQAGRWERWSIQPRGDETFFPMATIHLDVRNIEASIEFYYKLGLALSGYRNPDADGIIHEAGMYSGNVRLRLHQDERLGESKSSQATFTMYVPVGGNESPSRGSQTLKAWREKLIARGIAAGPLETSGSQVQFWILDPDGNRVGFNTNWQ